MIHVDLGEEINRRGMWRWRVTRYGLEGKSKRPLQDACRALRRAGINPNATVGLFRGRLDPEGRPSPDTVCLVGEGVPNENKGET